MRVVFVRLGRNVHRRAAAEEKAACVSVTGPCCVLICLVWEHGCVLTVYAPHTNNPTFVCSANRALPHTCAFSQQRSPEPGAGRWSGGTFAIMARAGVVGAGGFVMIRSGVGVCYRGLAWLGG